MQDASGKCSQVQLCANRKAMNTSAHTLSSLAQLCIQEDIHTRLFRRAVLDDVMSQNEHTTMIMSIWVTASYQTLFFYCRDQVQDKGVQIKTCLSTAKELQNGLIDTQGFQQSVSTLEKDFSALVLQSEHWNDSIAQALVSVKGFEDEIRAIENRCIEGAVIWLFTMPFSKR